MCSIRIICRPPPLSLSLTLPASILRYFRTIGFIARNVPTDKTTSRFLHGFALTEKLLSALRFFSFFFLAQRSKISNEWDFRNVTDGSKKFRGTTRGSIKDPADIIRDIHPNKLVKNNWARPCAPN